MIRYDEVMSCDVVTDMASWRDGGKPAAVSENPPDDRTTNENFCTSVSAASADPQIQAAAYMMHHYPLSSFHGHSMRPPYMAMRPPAVKPAAMGPMPFHMSHMPMVPPSYNPMMMTPFVRIFSLYSAN